MGDWISVDDRLPEMVKKTTYGESKRVLFYLYSRNFPLEAYFGKVIYMPNGDFLCFQVEGFSQDQKVSHWREINPPKLSTTKEVNDG